MHDVVAVCADRHRELHLILADLPGVETWLRGYNVVERCQAESSACRKPDAEILGMAIGRTEQPEYDLRFEKSLVIFVGNVASLEQIVNSANAGAAVRLVFAGRRNGERLTTILLRHAEKPSVTGSCPVKALDRQDALACEIDDLRFRDGQAERRDKFKAEVLILDAVSEAGSIWQATNLRLENMGGRGRAVRHLPFAVPVQQGGFFLRSRKRNPKLLILADAERTSREVADDFCNFFIAHRTGIDNAGLADGHAVGKELKRADAIPPDSRKEAIGIGSFRLRPFGKPAPNVVIVGQQIFKDREDRIADLEPRQRPAS
jgi:hypothetical protein